jgi:hypothetical protein
MTRRTLRILWELEKVCLGATLDVHGLELAPDQLRAVLTHQLELEIALRKRVAKVVEARIAWAEQLKEAIFNSTLSTNRR